MPSEIPGIHHVTAISSDPQRNAEFYSGVLGLRLVKRTVNFDSPGTYHLYYGDERGSPGTLLTFFPWPGLPRGRPGSGQVAGVSFSVPDGSLDFWAGRLGEAGAGAGEPRQRFGERALPFTDPDGLRLELVAGGEPDTRPPWENGPVPPEHAIRGLRGVTLAEDQPERSDGFLRGTLGFRRSGEEGGRIRYRSVAETASRIDVLPAPDGSDGRVAVGSIHHVAFRTPDEEAQKDWRTAIRRTGTEVTPVIDRHYFHSIYFREPGGALFEIATDVPGMVGDEPLERLGQRLVLPPWLEERRAVIERELPPIQPPAVSAFSRGSA